MLNTNNTVNYEINVKQKYSWSTVFAWLYLKTIGRILPKKWNKWAENILYYNTTTGSDETHTDKITDESAQIDLKPKITVKESQSEIISKDETTFQNTKMQTECVEIISKDGEVQTEENSEFTDESCFSTGVNGEFIDEDYDSMEEISTEEEEDISHKLERSQNFFLKEEIKELKFKNEELEREKSEVTIENEQLKLQLAGYEEDYTELGDVSDQTEKKRSTEIEELKRQLSTAVKEREDSKNEVARLQEQVERLNAERERVRNIAISSIEEHTKTLDENLTLKNQHIESSPAEDKQLNGEKDTQEQTKSYKAGVVSLDNKSVLNKT
ncbi:MAG: hypothetical protein ABS808_04625 [Wolbachia endosymbiont of Polyergus mexicanus]|uniref:Uncharacterized protein n=1 Tax=Wolbachia endosymbiont of Polyergus mexicanus TaxID=3171167 RepID=A0AAU7YIQ9_9RICK